MTEIKTILITGGAGYIASHVIIELLHENYSVIAIDNLINSYSSDRNEKPESIKRIEKITGKSVIFHNICISNQAALQCIFQLHNIDVVIHVAALKVVGESLRRPLVYYNNNVLNSIILLRIMTEHKVKKMLFASSSNVYGIPEYLPVDENHPTGWRCANPYGRSKYFVEEILKDLCIADEEWKVIVLRYFNTSGAHISGLIGENPLGPSSNLLPYIMQVAVGKKSKVKVYGSDYDTTDGTCLKDFTHVMDIAIGHVRALEKLNATNFNGWTAYNLGAGQGCTILEVIKAFSKASNTEIPYEILERRQGDVGKMYADVTKAQNELNWFSTRTIHDICEDIWRWWTLNPEGYK